MVGKFYYVIGQEKCKSMVDYFTWLL